MAHLNTYVPALSAVNSIVTWVPWGFPLLSLPWTVPLLVVPENAPAPASMLKEWSPPRGFFTVSLTGSPALIIMTLGPHRTYSPTPFSVSAAGESISTAHWQVLFHPVTIRPSSMVTVKATVRAVGPGALVRTRPTATLDSNTPSTPRTTAIFAR